MHPNNKIDSLALMDPTLRRILETEAKEKRYLESKRHEKGYNSRQIYERLHPKHKRGVPAMAKVEEREFVGPHGNFPVRIYRPRQAKGETPAIVFVHGGGFGVGSLDTHDGIMRCLAEDTGAVVLGVGYHLAPAQRFPVPLTETFLVLEALQRGDFHSLHINPGDITLAGDSAGATIVLGVYLKWRDEQQARISSIRGLLLFYGLFGLKGSMSGKLYGSWWDGMTETDLSRYLRCYIDDEESNHPYFNLFESDLSWGMPPVYLLACALDPLLDDSRTLYETLQAHGQPVTLEVMPEMTHACLYYFREIPGVRRTLQNIAGHWASLPLEDQG